MKHVRVRLAAGGREAEIHPMYDLMVDPDVVVRGTALQWNYTGEALGMLHYVEGEADTFETRVADTEEALAFAVEPADEHHFYAYVRCSTTEPIREMFSPITENAFVVVPPVVYHEDGSVSFSVFGVPGDIQEAIDAVPEPVDVTVEEISGLAGLTGAVGTGLSNRQREAIVTAIDLGYYDIPREATHEDVAETLGCAPSTAAEHLRKAESKALQALFR